MNAFEFVRPKDIDDAGELLTADGTGAKIIAGGTDLLGEIKEGVVRPARLVSLQDIEALQGIEEVGEMGVEIGAMTTLAEIAAHPRVRDRQAVLAQACYSVATPQIRNVATLGGNLFQRPRCWYYRSPLFDCRKKGGDKCFAHNGANKFHTIFDTEICPAVHPSDTAVALTALDARLVLLGPASTARLMEIEDLFVSPSVDPTVENALRNGEILAKFFIPYASTLPSALWKVFPSGIPLPPPSSNVRGVYLKAKERQAMDFALASVAMIIGTIDDTVSLARVVLGGVASAPRRAHAAEDALLGERISEIDAGRIGRIAVEGASPLSDNGYKVRLASNLVSRAVKTLLDIDGQEGVSP